MEFNQKQKKSPRFLTLDSNAYFGKIGNWEETLQNELTILDMYNFPYANLESFSCLVIDGLVDQEMLYEEKERIRQFLDEKKILLFCGHLFRHWLPGGSLFVPKMINSHRDYAVSIHQPHPIFMNVSVDDMTFRRGVAGFFARGHHPPPPEAEILLQLPGGEPITYIDRYSTRGTIIVHAGNNLFSYNSGQREDTTRRIGYQLRMWLREEHRRIRQERRA